MSSFARLAIVAFCVVGKASLAQVQGQEECFASMIATGPPGNVFDSAESAISSISATTVQRCGLQFPECFEAKGIAGVEPSFIPNFGSVCREVLRYTVPLALPVEENPSTSISEEFNCKTPDLQDPCVCQVPTQGTPPQNITFEVKLTTENCCQQCSCIGDPHCTAFSGKYDNWVVCNARNPQGCEMNRNVCQAKKWNGVQCVYNENNRGDATCLPDKSSPLQPTMNMYSKIYVDNSTGLQASMQVDLRLGSMGNIVCVTATWGPTAAGSTKIVKQICAPDFFNTPNGDFVGVADMQELFAATKVQVAIQIKNPQGLAQRLELTIDDKDTAAEVIRDGFCETGVIREKLAEDTVLCLPSDSFIFKRMCWSGLVGRAEDCTRRSGLTNQVNQAKRQWCLAKFPNSNGACVATPWYLMVCKLLCRGDTSCEAECESRITEVPNEVIQDLKAGLVPQTRQPTFAPTACPSLLQPVNHDPQFPTPANAFLIVEKQSPTDANTWLDMRTWFSKEEAACGQKLSFLADSELMDRGATYRMLQCQPMVNRCGEKVVQVDAKVTFSNSASSSGGLSKPLRVLYDTGKLFCSRTKYPLCPPEYKCCIWTPSQKAEWQFCMATFHPSFINNPNRPCAPTWD